jgi:hypothetical protein
MAVQITFDCADAHAQAAFWAVAMDHEVEDHDAQVGAVVDAGHLSSDSPEIETVDGRRRFTAYAATKAKDESVRLLFQVVDEPKTAKNRVHLDLHVDDPEAKVAALLELGATKLWDGQQGPMTWVTLADPEGNELCVS